MIKRTMQNILLEMFHSFPVVTITGPRQSGKTTLVKMTFPDMAYISLEDLDMRQFAEDDPRGLLSQYENGLIIDEVQHVPKLLSYIQTVVDKKSKPGLFILTGSNQFEYMHSITQSLAGRTGILKLLPFSFAELYGKNTSVYLEEVMFKGFYPRIFDQNIRPQLFLSSYMESYLERDVRSLLNIRNLHQFHRFLQICAGRTGQILNMSGLGNEIGVSHKTIREWISVLEASYIIFLLKPFHRNYNKRIIKSPKLYFIDVGLSSHLLGIENFNQLKTHPLRGELFETFVVIEFLKYRFNWGLQNNLYYFRDNVGNEVDLIIETGDGLFPVEIKSGKTINSQFFKGLQYFKKLDTKNVKTPALIIGDIVKQKRTECFVYGYPFVEDLSEKLMG